MMGQQHRLLPMLLLLNTYTAMQLMHQYVTAQISNKTFTQQRTGTMGEDQQKQPRHDHSCW